MELDFKALENEVMGMLDKRKIIVLATCSDNIVTARSMSYVMVNNKICFQTSTAFKKYEQIANNPNVALCTDNIQIEGIAAIKNNPYEKKEFLELFKKVHRGSFDKYSHMQSEVVIEVEPTFVTLWKYEDGNPLRDFLDRRNRKAYRKYYDTSI